MTYEPKNGPAPSDEEAERAWDEIMEIASKNALILQSYAGTATLVIPRVQREVGVRAMVLRAGLWELES